MIQTQNLLVTYKDRNVFSGLWVHQVILIFPVPRDGVADCALFDVKHPVDASQNASWSSLMTMMLWHPRLVCLKLFRWVENFSRRISFLRVVLGLELRHIYVLPMIFFIVEIRRPLLSLKLVKLLISAAFVII